MYDQYTYTYFRSMPYLEWLLCSTVGLVGFTGISLFNILLRSLDGGLHFDAQYSVSPLYTVLYAAEIHTSIKPEESRRVSSMIWSNHLNVGPICFEVFCFIFDLLFTPCCQKLFF